MGLDLTGSNLLWVLVLFTAGLVCCLFLPVVEAFFHTKQERRQLKTGK